MKRTYFHGTSGDNLKKILRDGFRPDIDAKIWTVSDRGVYLWSPDALAEQGDCEADGQNEYAKGQAYSSATCACAIAKKDVRAVVFEIELDDENVTEDLSCENMSGAVVCFDSIPASCIKSVWVTDDLALVRGFFIASMMGRDMFAHAFSELERKIGDALLTTEFYLEDNFELHPYRGHF